MYDVRNFELSYSNRLTNIFMISFVIRLEIAQARFCRAAVGGGATRRTDFTSVYS